MAVKRRKTTFGYSWWHWGFVWRHKFPQTVMCGSYYSVWTVNGITYVDHIIFKTPTSSATFRYVYIIRSLTNNHPYDCNSFLTSIHSLVAELHWFFLSTLGPKHFIIKTLRYGAVTVLGKPLFHLILLWIHIFVMLCCAHSARLVSMPTLHHLLLHYANRSLQWHLCLASQHNSCIAVILV